jgi:hypothetical protein
MARWRALPGAPAPGRALPGLSWSPSPRWAMALGLAGLAALLGMVERREFVYFQF